MIDRRIQSALWALTSLGLCVASGTQAAEPFCVICEDPNVSYRCEVAGVEPAAATGAGAQLLCITELAKSGAHSRCRIHKSAPQLCAAEQMRIVIPPDPNLVPQPPREIVRPNPDVPPVPLAEDLTEPEDTGPPKTVEDLAKQTAKSSQEGLKNAGKAVSDTFKSAGEQVQKTGKAVGEGVGNTAKKTWNCLTSFFSDC